ncbi:hypothetical protein QBC43DRAFT_308304 [Cladorrhinum sp. PSN259]|nr:hypothetical protein QBC43DRAFT_308304 [Cladorrhinum sp. PSN259]
MAHATNGFLSSDDELSAKALATEPMNYEFQSELSDSDAPDPIALDEITQPFVQAAVLHNAPSSLPPLQRKMPDAPMEIVTDLEPLSTTNGHAAGNNYDVEMHNVFAKAIKGRPIEVLLNWMAIDERAEYEPIEVGEYIPDYYYDGRGRKRLYGVSRCDW